MYKPSQMVPPVDLFNSEFDPQLPYATRVSSYEAFPGVTLPLDLTSVALVNDQCIRRQLRDLGIKTIDPPWLLACRTHQGRVYVNLSWILWVGDLLPGTDAGDMEQQLFGQHIPFEVTRPRVTRRERWLRALNLPRFATMMGLAVLSCKNRLSRYLTEREQTDFDSLGLDRLAERIDTELSELIRASDWHTRGSLVSMEMIGLLNNLVGEEKARHIIPIISDVGEVESAAPAKRIRELAALAKSRHGAIHDQLKNADSPWQTLADIDGELHKELSAVVTRYGYRSVAEFVVSAPSWADDPTPVMDAFLGLLRADGPAATDRTQARLDAHKRLLEGLGPLKRLIADLLVRGARIGARTRERTKAGLIVRVDIVRRLCRAIARRLVEAGRIDREGDLYLLTLDEVRAALGGTEQDLAATIATRKQTVEALKAMPEPPELIYGHQPVKVADVDERDGQTILKGLGVSGDAVEGIARVITSTDQLDTFEPGEILIAQYTDAGWTPYFTLASAVVVETGGLLTHTSVVSRELGLPAVVNVRDVTTRVKTGDRLRVDPDRGEVTLLDQAAGGDQVVSRAS